MRPFDDGYQDGYDSDPIQGFDFGGGGGGADYGDPYDGGEDDDSSVTVTASDPTPIDTITSIYDGLVGDDSDDANSVTVTTGWDDPMPVITSPGDGMLLPFEGPGSTGNDLPLVFRGAPVTSISNTTPAASAGASAGTYKPTVPKTPNAGTVYGDDPSASNNYGLGDSAPSVYTLTQAETATAARPSIWWLLAALALIWMVA